MKNKPKIINDISIVHLTMCILVFSIVIDSTNGFFLALIHFHHNLLSLNISSLLVAAP